LSLSSKTLFIASITRESSPPEAIFASGFTLSPLFAEIINSAVSQPRLVYLPFSSSLAPVILVFVNLIKHGAIVKIRLVGLVPAAVISDVPHLD